MKERMVEEIKKEVPNYRSWKKIKWIWEDRDQTDVPAKIIDQYFPPQKFKRKDWIPVFSKSIKNINLLGLVSSYAFQ